MSHPQLLKLMKFRYGCSGKIPYLTQREAKGATRTNKHAPGGEVYKCKYLLFGREHWHITHMPRGIYKRKMRAIERRHAANQA